MNMTIRILGSCGLIAMLVLLNQPASGQDVYVYPAKGQSDEQLAEDRYACHRWAVEESGFDPSQFKGVAPPRTVRVPVPRNEAAGTEPSSERWLAPRSRNKARERREKKPRPKLSVKPTRSRGTRPSWHSEHPTIGAP